MLEANAGYLVFRQRAILARLQRFIQHDVANTFTMQADDVVTHRREHAFHLMVAPFAYR
jgi:hypothetical protein